MGIFAYDFGQQGGIRPPLEEFQNQFAWGRRELTMVWPAQVDGATRDSGSTPTSVLRQGLLMGIVTATKLWKQYDNTATDGTEVARGVLLSPALRMVDINGNNQAKQAVIAIAGGLIAAKILNLDLPARSHFYNRFIFDDDQVGNSYGWLPTLVKTTNYTVTAADNNRIFTTRGAGGAVAFTLPTIARGLHFKFINEVDQNMTVQAPVANTLVAFNNLTATSVAFSTGSQKIGGSVEIFPNDNASKWIAVINLASASQTVTVA